MIASLKDCLVKLESTYFFVTTNYSVYVPIFCCQLVSHVLIFLAHLRIDCLLSHIISLLKPSLCDFVICFKTFSFKGLILQSLLLRHFDSVYSFCFAVLHCL